MTDARAPRGRWGLGARVNVGVQERLLFQASAVADEDFRNGLPGLPPDDLHTIFKVVEDRLGEALRTTLLMNCRGSVQVERRTLQRMPLQVAAVGRREPRKNLFPSTPMPKTAVDGVLLAPSWSSTLVCTIVIIDAEEWTTTPCHRATTDVHTMAIRPMSTPRAIVALVFGVTVAAWNGQDLGKHNTRRDKSRPVVRVVVRSEQKIRSADTDAIPRCLCMILVVLLAVRGVHGEPVCSACEDQHVATPP